MNGRDAHTHTFTNHRLAVAVFLAALRLERVTGLITARRDATADSAVERHADAQIADRALFNCA
eukprot:6203682-Pleurochrysis_carterae.AAC.1